VAARLQSAGEVDRDLPAEFGFPSQGCLAAFAFLKEADMLAFGDLQDGESVARSAMNIGRLERRFEGLLGCSVTAFRSVVDAPARKCAYR
jgi:hypothetical protein